MMRRDMTPLLQGLAGALAIAGVAFVVLPVGTSMEPVAPHLPAAASASSEPVPDTDVPTFGREDAESIVNTNLFSATRRAPRVAFVAPGLFDANAPADGAGIAMDAGVNGAVDSPEPVLEGIVIRDGQSRALLRLANAGDDASAAPRLLAPGERLGAYRVRSIGSDHVVLTSAGGVRTLRLQRQPQSDSSAPRP